jgi:hypothetical protein
MTQREEQQKREKRFEMINLQTGISLGCTDAILHKSNQ